MPLPRRIPLLSLRRTTRSLTTSRPFLAGNSVGSGPDDHVTNRTDELDVQSAASKAGEKERVENASRDSASSEKDVKKDNERAKKESPESPVVIGMNDERGGVVVEEEVWTLVVGEYDARL
ncbi:hypothetical protein MMC30_008051 [Trapelia coarctata]|nr:hypothetical protein [Trapelia coarctata]